MLHNPEYLMAKVKELEFLTFFKNALPEFSVEAMCPTKLWYTDQDGSWEWTGRICEQGVDPLILPTTAE